MTAPAFIQDDGTIYVHVASGGTAVLEFQTEAGDPRDVSGDTITFKTEDYEVDLTNGVSVDLKELTLLGSALPLTYLDKKNDYLILDMSTNPPTTVMSGTLIVDDWN